MGESDRARTVPERERPSWAYWLGCSETAFDEPGLHLFPNERLDSSPTIIVLAAANGTYLSIPARGYEHYAQRLASLKAGHLVALVDLINGLGDAVKQVGYILWQGSLEPERFRPRPDARVSQLSGEALRALHALQEASHPTEWAHSCLDYSSDTTYAITEAGGAVAAAHYILLRPGLASIGVLTAPGRRGAGNAGAVVSAAVQRALNEGHAVHYQTLLENYPSVALAESLGFRQFGLSVQIRLHPME